MYQFAMLNMMMGLMVAGPDRTKRDKCAHFQEDLNLEKIQSDC